jgi:fumarate reductase subunit C
MKLLIIMALSLFSLPVFAQTSADLEVGWLGTVTSNSSDFNLLTHAVIPRKFKGTRFAAGFTNFYTQKSCNAMHWGLRKSDFAKSYGLGGFIFGNGVMRQFGWRVLFAKALSEQTQMGLCIDLERTRFPEITLLQWKWDWSISYQAERYNGIFWIRGNAQRKEWWQSRGHYGTAWSYVLSESTEINASAVFKLYQKTTIQVGIFHAFNHQWKGFLSYQVQPMQWVLGLIKSTPHFKLAISVMFSAMPLPCFDHQWLYERN